MRYYQFLRTPSVLQDALARRAAIGMTEQDESAHRWETLPAPLRRFLYRLALERFEVEAALERWLGRPVVALATWLDSQASSKTGPSGIGVGNYNWYLKNVQLVPYTWQDEVTLRERDATAL